MYKIPSASILFLLLPQMYEWLAYRRFENGCEEYTGTEVWFFSEPFFFPSASGRNLPPYITSRTSRQIFVITPLPDCHLYIARGHAYFLHATHVQFDIGTRGFSCSFRSARVELPPRHRQMAKRFFSQYPTLDKFQSWINDCKSYVKERKEERKKRKKERKKVFIYYKYTTFNYFNRSETLP